MVQFSYLAILMIIYKGILWETDVIILNIFVVLIWVKYGMVWTGMVWYGRVWCLMWLG